MTKEKITLSKLEQYLSKAAWILKGPVDASDFKVYIFPLLFFKRISDVYDEEYRTALDESDGDKEYANLPEFHRFIIPDGCHWRNVRETTDSTPAVVERIVGDIDSIVRAISFPGWQHSNQGEREVQQALRKSLLKYKLHKDQVLFSRAYSYIKEYY